MWSPLQRQQILQTQGLLRPLEAHFSRPSSRNQLNRGHIGVPSRMTCQLASRMRLTGRWLLFCLASIAVCLQPLNAQDGNTRSGRRLAGPSDREQDARDALTAMITQLSGREYVAFVRLRFPIRDYLEIRESPGDSRLQNLQFFDVMKSRLRLFEDAEVRVTGGGQFATFRRTIKADEQPAPKPPYTGADAEDPGGYPGELKQAIQAALNDLQRGRTENFMSKMFPPSAIDMLKADQRWDFTVENLSRENSERHRMLDDLQRLLEASPEVKGDVAEFRLPHFLVIRDQPDPGEDELVEVDDSEGRLVRFSRINGTWRFEDAATETANRISEAVVAGRRDRDAELHLEKIGSDWRLVDLDEVSEE
ncbi:MAG: hypothetical protein KDA85_20900 [Planctomycetaceae bacterium]|nr:hypothetical protein [Planctomycetaceae bacterium]